MQPLSILREYCIALHIWLPVRCILTVGVSPSYLSGCLLSYSVRDLHSNSKLRSCKGRPTLRLSAATSVQEEPDERHARRVAKRLQLRPL